MHPGLTADDIYIMVEDEFHAIAQSFTKHLHHAEYVRLKNAAKNRNASTINTISRPVDSITSMREETRRKKKAEATAAKMKSAIEQVEPAKRPLVESEESDLEEDRHDDPWQGTQLQRFMTTSPRKNLTGLTGLQGVTSNTRAAAGFQKPKGKEEERIMGLLGAISKKTPAVKEAVPQAAEESTSSSDDDDLDVPARLTIPGSKVAARPARNQAEYPPSPTANTKSATAPNIFNLNSPFLRSPKKPIPPVTHPPSNLKAPEEVQSPLLKSNALRRRLKARREKERKDRNNPEDKIGADEIPVFLV